MTSPPYYTGMLVTFGTYPNVVAIITALADHSIALFFSDGDNGRSIATVYRDNVWNLHRVRWEACDGESGQPLGELT